MSIIQTKKELKPRRKNDLYPTPMGLCRGAMSYLSGRLALSENPPVILDPGAGGGNWGKAIKEVYPDSKLIGVEIDKQFSITDDYDVWFTEDILENSYSAGLVIGNPPFSLAEEFINKGFDILPEGGIMVYLLRVSYLNSQRRYKNLWKVTPPIEVIISSRRPSFTGNRHTDDTDYALYIWSKGWSGDTLLNWLMWEYSDED